MIQNKSPRINLSLFTAFGLFTVVACSSSPEQPESAKPVVDSPPPEEVLRSEPIDNSEAIPAAPEPDMPAASPIREGIPDRYVVKKGDTLWDISSHFLKDPWLWPEVWHVNPEIRNPHLIYPGDVIALTWRDGKPSISIVGAEGEPPPPPPRTDLTTVKLSPSAREEKLRRAIDTIPKSAISAFLTRPYILDNATLNSAPFIVSNYGDYIISGRGAKIYARPLLDADNI
ncbi:MAG: LysM peptidoglycan-binding domain-containing protein, partial [Thioalkalispiraceae bacterium]